MIVTFGAVVPAVLVSFMASYAIIRDGRRWFLRSVNSVFLMGLAIPLQATIIPVYLLIIKLKLYDTLLALILPSIAFAIPLSVLVLSNFIRDVPKELFESMRVDGASEWAMLWRLAFPLTRPALVTVTIYNGLTIWNGFLLPLVLTQSPDKRTLALCAVDVPGPVQRQRAGGARVGRADRAADPRALHRRPPATAQRPQRRLLEVGARVDGHRREQRLRECGQRRPIGDRSRTGRPVVARAADPSRDSSACSTATSRSGRGCRT